CTEEEAREETVRATRRFARRQDSWFRREARVRWLDGSAGGRGVPRSELDHRIAERVDRMWRAGLVEEVRRLEAEGLREGRTASRALGYQQILAALAGECTEEEAREETVRATRRFARRQDSWFRREARVRWLDGSAGGRGELTAAAGALLEPSVTS
ncbi:hypothetical protein FNX48_019960, partial [Streptomyces sp. IF17]|nr:hypothetical protein [Streptomyces alkaliphilus]